MPERTTNDNPFAAPEAGLPSVTDGAAPSHAGATTDGQGSYSVEFELQVEDLVSFQVQHWKTTPALRRQRLTQRIVQPLAVIVIGGLIMAFDRSQPRLLWLVMFATLSLVVAFNSREASWRRLMDRNVRKHYSEGKNRKLFGWHRVTIDAAGIHETSQYWESFIRWRGVERVDVSFEHVLIDVTTAYSVLIPKLAFRDQWQLDAFVEAAQRYHREAEQGVG